jgi:hypothetical protein
MRRQRIVVALPYSAVSIGGCWQYQRNEGERSPKARTNVIGGAQV